MASLSALITSSGVVPNGNSLRGNAGKFGGCEWRSLEQRERVQPRNKTLNNAAGKLLPALRWTREIHRPLSPGPIIIHRVPRKTTGPPLCGPALAAFNTIVPRAAYCRKFPLSLLFRRIMSRDLWPRVISFGLDRSPSPFLAIRKLPPIYSLIFILLFFSPPLLSNRSKLDRFSLTSSIETNTGQVSEHEEQSIQVRLLNERLDHFDREYISREKYRRRKPKINFRIRKRRAAGASN